MKRNQRPSKRKRVTGIFQMLGDVSPQDVAQITEQLRKQGVKDFLVIAGPVKYIPVQRRRAPKLVNLKTQ